MSERGAHGRRDRFDGGGLRRDRGGETRRFNTRAGSERFDAAGQDAVRRAAQQRPEGGYSLEDFGDIPMPREAAAADGDASNAADANASARTQDVDGSMRLQKALANAGVASRRVSEELIVDGKVKVNGKVVTELGSRVHPEHDRIEVKGTAVQVDQSMRYVLLNKPTGVVSTMHDDQGRPDLRQFTRGWNERLYNVGRLDGETSGLLILTNDGDLANVLAHPSYGVEKTYVAKVRGNVAPQTIQRLLDGFELDDGFIKADRAVIVAEQPSASATLVELTLHSGRNRIVRRMLDHVEHPVLELVRRSFGPLHLGTLRVGETRELTQTETGKLLTLARRAQRRPERTDGASDGADARGRDERRSRDSRSGDGRGDRRSGGSRPGASRSAQGRSAGPGRPSRDRDDRGRGGAPSGGRGDREYRSDDRDRRPRTTWSGRGPEPRSEGSRSWPGARDAMGGSGGRRPGRDDRRERDDRGGRDGWRSRDDRGGREDRSGRDDRGGRDGWRGRDDRGGRDARPSRDDRGGRDGWRSRDDRGGRDAARSFGDRDRRDDRGGRPGGFGRDDRERRDDRGGRPGGSGRDDRERRGGRDGGRTEWRGRDERAGGNRSGGREGWRGSDDRRRDDHRGGRGEWRDRNDRAGRDDRGGREDRGPRSDFGSRDDRGGRNDFGSRDDRRGRDDRGGRDGGSRGPDDRGGRPWRDDRGGPGGRSGGGAGGRRFGGPAGRPGGGRRPGGR